MNPRSTHVASLLFDKRVFTPGQARAWAHAHGFKYGTVELGGPASRYVHLPQREGGRVKRVVSFGSRYSGIRAIVARNPLRHPVYDEWYNRLREHGAITIHPGDLTSKLESALRRRAKHDGFSLSIQIDHVEGVFILSLFKKGSQGPGRKAYLKRISR